MTTLGRNVTTYALDGKFDDCQALVKRAFADPALGPPAAQLGQLDQHRAAAPAGRLLRLRLPAPGRGRGRRADRLQRPLRQLRRHDGRRHRLADGVAGPAPRDRHQRQRRGPALPRDRPLPEDRPVSDLHLQRDERRHPSNLARLVDLYGGWMDETGLLKGAAGHGPDAPRPLRRERPGRRDARDDPRRLAALGRRARAARGRGLGGTLPLPRPGRRAGRAARGVDRNRPPGEVPRGDPRADRIDPSRPRAWPGSRIGPRPSVGSRSTTRRSGPSSSGGSGSVPGDPMVADESVDRAATLTLSAFNWFNAIFQVLTRRAQRRFRERDWAGGRRDSTERFDLYERALDLAETWLDAALGPRTLSPPCGSRPRPVSPPSSRTATTSSAPRPSTTPSRAGCCRPSASTAKSEFFHLHPKPVAPSRHRRRRPHLRQPGRHGVARPDPPRRRGAGRSLGGHRPRCRLIAQEIDLCLWPLIGTEGSRTIEVVKAVFYRRKEAYIVAAFS